MLDVKLCTFKRFPRRKSQPIFSTVASLATCRHSLADGSGNLIDAFVDDHNRKPDSLRVYHGQALYTAESAAV